MRILFKTVFSCFLLMVTITALCRPEISIAIKEKDEHFYSGEKLKRTLILSHNGQTSEICQLQWTTSMLSDKLQKGKDTISIPPDANKEVQVTLKLPKTKKKIDLNWTITAGSGTRDENSLHAVYMVFPEHQIDPLKEMFNQKKVGLYDPAGSIKQIFQDSKIPCRILSNQISLETFTGDLLIIGKDALTANDYFVFSVVQNAIDNGHTILFFSQKQLPRESLLPKLQPSAKQNNVHMCAPGHPVFNGLSSKDLKNWRGDGNNNTFLLKKPVSGNFTIIAQAYSDIAANSLDAVVLEEIRGKGRLIFSQILITDKIKIEPVAYIMFNNLVSYALNPPALLEKSVVFGSHNDPALHTLHKLGIQPVDTIDNLNNISKIILLPEDNYRQHLIDENSDFFIQISSFVHAGGTLILCNINPDIRDALGSVFPDDLLLTEQKARYFMPVIMEDSLLWGITRDDLMKLGSYDYSLGFSTSTEAMLLVEPGKIASFNYGKGTIIVSQINFFKEADEHSLYCISQFLTNAHIQLMPNSAVSQPNAIHNPETEAEKNSLVEEK